MSSLRLCCPQRAPLPYCAGYPDSVCLSLRAPGALRSDMLAEAFSHSCPTLRLHSGGTLLVSSKKQKKINFFMKGEPLARFPMLLLYNFVFSLLLLIIPSSSLKVIKVPSDFNMLIIVYQHIINEIPDYFFIKLIQLTKLC